MTRLSPLWHLSISRILAVAALCFCNPLYALDCAQPQGDGNSVEPNAVSAQAMIHQFDSGAQWQLCWHIDSAAGLTVSEVHYGAPGEALTKVLESAALAQILFKYDEDIKSSALLTEPGLGETKHVASNQLTCPHGNVIQQGELTGICQSIRDLNNLTTTRRETTLRRREISLTARSQVNNFLIDQVWRFSEDGEISPEVQLGGELDRFTTLTQYGSSIGPDKPLAANATILYSWRLDFNLGDTPENDIVDIVEFVPHETSVVRRAIKQTPVTTESFHKVKREHFRGWLIKDADTAAGANNVNTIGYYLDPQSSGFDFISRRHNWAGFDVAVTKNKPCERLASDNLLFNTGCGNNLDEYISSETLVGADPVVWFNLARQFLPKTEDFPKINSRDASFTLTPFDWSAYSPFSAPPE